MPEFRHIFPTLLKAKGEYVKVVQELLSSTYPGQTDGVEQGGEHDLLKINLYR